MTWTTTPGAPRTTAARASTRGRRRCASTGPLRPRRWDGSPPTLRPPSTPASAASPAKSRWPRRPSSSTLWVRCTRRSRRGLACCSAAALSPGKAASTPRASSKPPPSRTPAKRSRGFHCYSTPRPATTTNSPPSPNSSPAREGRAWPPRTSRPRSRPSRCRATAAPRASAACSRQRARQRPGGAATTTPLRATATRRASSRSGAPQAGPTL
mmetsp:Transcript_8064/g.27929  ORF Transcript_8064/g.27929 Transcript_8064/m.27929 type:complete len:212 (-) Transcript_8064:938-1573(-)